ncbi:hypothetical protein SDC9_175664 [bioreactor metagenome]|uniref:Uncharacterized protein n=1 Tax=bioreactor metagenome TaxID=1076179 RepID=A0A645GX47_9ZZZZ
MAVIIDHQTGSDILGQLQNTAASIDGMRCGKDQKNFVFEIFQLDDRFLKAERPNGGTVVAGGVALPDCITGNILGLQAGVFTIIDTVICWCDKAVLVKKCRGGLVDQIAQHGIRVFYFKHDLFTS